jgi:transposase
MQTKIKLSKEQQTKLLKLKKTSKSELVRDRAQAVLIRNEGFTLSETAKALHRSQSFVKDTIARFKDGQLLEKTDYTSHHSKLSIADRKAIIKMLKKKTPKDYGHKTQFWTIAIFKELLSRKYGVIYRDDKSYRNFFKAAGFSFHKPKPVDFRQDPERLKKFKGALKKSYTSTRLRFSW